MWKWSMEDNIFIVNCKPIAKYRFSKSNQATYSSHQYTNLEIVSTKQSSIWEANDLSVICQKCDRSICSKDNAPQKRRIKIQDPIENKARATNLPALFASQFLMN